MKAKIKIFGLLAITLLFMATSCAAGKKHKVVPCPRFSVNSLF